MVRFLTAVLCLAFLTATVRAHFVWVSHDGKSTASVVFGEGVAPDEYVPITKIKQTKLYVRGTEKESLKMTKVGNAYHVKVAANETKTLGGACVYGVLAKSGAPFLLVYHPKAIFGGSNDSMAKHARNTWKKLALQIVLRKGDEGKLQGRLLWQGKPVIGEVVAEAPGQKSVKMDTNPQGVFVLAAPKKSGLILIRGRYVEKRNGSVGDKKYTVVKHYATLTIPASAFNSESTSATKPRTAIQYPPLPKAVSSFGAAVAGDWLYVYGGHSEKPHRYHTEAVEKTFFRVHLTKPNGWQKLASGPGAQGIALVAHGGKVYRIGGMQPRNERSQLADNHSLDSVACYDPKTAKWTELPSLPKGRSSHDAVVLGDKIYVVGGWTMNGRGQKNRKWRDTMLVMDLGKKPLQWQKIKQPFQRRALTAAAYQGKIYVIAGLKSEGGVEPTVNIFDPNDNTWSTGPDVPGTRMNSFSPAACVCDHRLFLSTADGNVYRLSENEKTWERVGELEHSRIVHRMVAGPANALIVLGGASKGGNVAETETVSVSPVIENDQD